MTDINIVSYNARGLRVGHSETDRARRLVVDKLLETCDILCVQETFLAKQDLEKLNCIHKDFYGAGESTTDLSTRIIRGRIAGGVAILWHKKYDQLVDVIRLGVDWAIGLKFTCGDKHFIVLNIYTPYECPQNEDEFLNRLSFIMSFMQDNLSTCFFIVGDLNADVTDKHSTFATHLMQFCHSNALILSSKALLPNNSYTYISESWHTTSWLDHCICTADAHDSILGIRVNYDLATTDHIPFSLCVNMNCIPSVLPVDYNISTGKIAWDNLTEKDLSDYCYQTNDMFSNTYLPKGAISCRDMNCKDPQHGIELCTLYENVVKSLLISSKPLHKTILHSTKPGWNDYVKEHHAQARRALKAWADAGKQRHGPLFEYKKQANANFKHFLRFIRRRENTMRSDSLARKLGNNNVKDFWKEIKKVNNCKTSLPSTIDGVTGVKEITQLWKEHYSALFNCVKSDISDIGSIHSNENVIVSPQEIYHIIMTLKDNKACGMDNISTEHLKNASKKLCALLSMCFTGCLVHGLLPKSMLSVILVPTIKDKAGKISSLENYRPIALASSLSKVFERVLLNRLEEFLLTSDNQFGFKPKHGTDMCIFVLQEILDFKNSRSF
ncbi:uncharacterized protein LOC114150994 [Xiphophorus couchianus]|uniref:uncharacterized protein LOC114150994 n=1 Tax=Xiphophorus couchianus TaxID=32473 RepID=UPI001015E735|nr:uncharacterized protein LOC114150994 [Xiphophorus couchianus]